MTSDNEVRGYYEANANKLDTVREDIVFLEELLVELNSEEGWKKSVDRDGTRVYFRKDEDSPLLMNKLETLIPCETYELPIVFVRLLSLFAETDLMPKWFPWNMMKSHETLLAPTPFTRSTHVKINMPFPISKVLGARDCIIRGKGFDLSERKSAAIAVAPLEVGTNFHGMVVPEPEKGYTRFVLRGAYYFEMHRDGIVFKQMQMLDLNSRFIPTPVMNWLSKGELPLIFLSKIKGALARYEGSEWQARVAKDTELYGDVEKRLADSVKREFGIETFHLNDKPSTLKSRNSMRRRLSSLRPGKKKKKAETVVEEAPEEEEEEEEADIIPDTTTAVLLSLQKVGYELFERCTASLGSRTTPT